MYVVVNTRTRGNIKYDKTANLSFAPTADIISETLPINEFIIDIYTEDDDIEIARVIKLYDDGDKCYAFYRIADVEQVDKGVLRVTAESALGKLDRKILKERMYTNDDVDDNAFNAIATILQYTKLPYYIDADLYDVPIHGYCPEQTARERLQWLCFVSGAVVKTFSGATNAVYVEFRDSTTSDVPVYNTYWKPSVTNTSYVTAVNVTAFKFTQDSSPQEGDETIVVNGVTYKVERTELVEENPVFIEKPYLDDYVPTSEVTFNDITLINYSNQNAIANRLGQYYFCQEELEADIVNDGDYMPTDKVSVSLESAEAGVETDSAVGFIESCDFTFGWHAKSRIRYRILNFVKALRLTVKYVYNNINLGMKKYKFPIGFGYTIQNPYIDQSETKDRYIYAPTSETITGTMPDHAVTVTQQYFVAIRHKKDKKVVQIVSVAGVSAGQPDEQGKVVVTIE